ncbi:DnaB-like helicase C-terminal domain-containing protein [Desulfomarina sp.]
MIKGDDGAIVRFYHSYLHGEYRDDGIFSGPCPFCSKRGLKKGTIIVFLNPESSFFGYFRCLNRCVPAGFPMWFARIASIAPSEVPGFDPDLPDFPLIGLRGYPVENINDDIRKYQDRLSPAVSGIFSKAGISASTLKELEVGFNGRYIVYPRFQEDGNCYSARCEFPDNPEDYFWHGNEQFSREPYNLFNLRDIKRCEQGVLFVCEGERNLLTLKQLGFPGVAVSHYREFENLDPELFERLRTVFIVPVNSPESALAARTLATGIGFRARILSWEEHSPGKYSLFRLAEKSSEQFRAAVGRMVKKARAFSPFVSPAREYELFLDGLSRERMGDCRRFSSGFACFDQILGGIHGINVIGGAPKVGKSTLMIQISSHMAHNRVPVLYYDFENGRQKIYQRLFSRLSRLSVAEIMKGSYTEQEKKQYDSANVTFREMLFFLRVINDRKLTPDTMRRHIDFIRQESGTEHMVIVVDSLHKLPFRGITEKKSGIDAWLRQLEAIRDESQVAFLVISELARTTDGDYFQDPHLGIFKGSGDIEYSADNAMVFYPSSLKNGGTEKKYLLELIASREHSPGVIAAYRTDYPFWGFVEQPLACE